MSEPGNPAVLDSAALDELQEMVGGDAAFLAELIDTFLDDGPTLLTAMQTAVAAGDAVSLRRAAHTLKSNSRTFGASALANLCQSIEEQATSEGLVGVDLLVAQVVGEYPEVVAALHAARPEM
jgi:HPt (histidine-containing phosphotransfer) domain-containing protein